MTSPAEIDRVLSGFGARALTEAGTVLTSLDRAGIAPEAFMRWLAARQAEEQRNISATAANRAREAYRRRSVGRKLRRRPRSCPDCGAAMRLHRGDAGDCQWVCPRCRRGIYRPNTAEAELEKIGIATGGENG